MDQGQLDALYQQYLGRGVDPSGAASWGGADYNTVVQGILGSQEYQNRNQPSQPQAQGMAEVINPGGGDINSIYQQYLGRGVDPSGAATYAGWDPQSIINAVTSSQEYRNRGGGGGGAGQSAPAAGNPQDLANQVFSLYRTNQNYDQQLNQLNAAPQNADYYRARIGLLGQQMGWQTGQNTGDRNSVYQQQLESYLPGAKAAGLSDAEINNLINRNAAQQSAVNQERIASDAKVPQGWVNQNIPGGWGTVAAAAALAAPYAIPALTAGFGAGAGGALTTTELLAGAGGAFVPVEGASFALPGMFSAGAGAIGQALPYTEAFDAANLFANGITDAGQLGDILASTGMDSFLAADMGNLAAQGLSAEQIAQVMGYSYTAPELAGTGIQSFAPNAASAATSMLSASQLANLAKGGTSIASLVSKLASNPSSKMPTSTSPSQLAKLLNPNGSTGSNQMAQSGSGFGLMKGNVNPFTYTKDVPVQTFAANKADPFAALNVPQTPIQPFNPLAHLVG
jgi:hypothetical protein